jgi:hypothetical protein
VNRLCGGLPGKMILWMTRSNATTQQKEVMCTVQICGRKFVPDGFLSVFQYRGTRAEKQGTQDSFGWMDKYLVQMYTG